MTRATVAAMKAEARRFSDALAQVQWEPGYNNGPERPKHGHMARVKRASLILCQFLAEFRRGKLP